MSTPLNQTIRAAYNNCRPEESLSVGDPRYVDFSGRHLRGADGDIVGDLFDALTIADSATHILMSGFRGSGKTTELRRLEKALQDNDYWVVFIDSEDYLNLTVPATISDLWISIAAGFDAFLEANDALMHNFHRFWDRASAFLNREVLVSDVKIKGDVKAVAASGGVEFKLALKENPDFRAQLNAALEAKRPKLVEECRQFVQEAIALLSRKATRGTVAIIDSFEKLQGTTRNSEEVRESAETLFVRDWRLLQTPCHAVYTVPPWLSFIEAGANDELGRTYMLSMCKVTNRQGEKCPEGLNALRDLLRQRMDLEKIFGSAELIEPLLSASGGYPRDLLRLIREVLLRNVRAGSLPIPAEKAAADVERAIALLAEQYEHAMDGGDIPLLKRVAQERDVRGWTKVDKLRIASLFDHHFVLSYQNGERWLDLHPLVAKAAAIQNSPDMDQSVPDSSSPGPAQC